MSVDAAVPRALSDVEPRWVESFDVIPPQSPPPSRSLDGRASSAEEEESGGSPLREREVESGHVRVDARSDSAPARLGGVRV